jgi:YidC/Oxa1 family membrane protein insertase
MINLGDNARLFVAILTHEEEEDTPVIPQHRAIGRRTAWIVVLALLGLTLAGCAPQQMEPIDENTEGFFNRYFIYNFSLLLLKFGEWFGGNYGLSVIVVALLIRIALMPLMRKQYLTQRRTQEKMKIVQPKLMEIQEKYKGQNTPEAQKKMQQEMMQLYQEHQFNPLAIGCLPMLIQLPFLIAFYYAILRTPEIYAHEFLWFNLGEVDVIMALIAAGAYFLQGKLAQKINGQQQTAPNPAMQQMAFLMYLPAVMIGIVSVYSPAVLPLYWTVGAVFLAFQSWLFHRLYGNKPAAQAEAGPKA